MFGKNKNVATNIKTNMTIITGSKKTGLNCNS